MRYKFSFNSWLSLLLVINASFCLAVPGRAAGNEGVKITDLGDKLRVEINGELFTEYYYKNVSRPFLYPVIGPGGVEMTRDFPMKTPPGESHDHPHHRSVWFAHGNINGCDFWSELPPAGTTQHEKFIEVTSGEKMGTIKSLNKLVTKDGKVIGTEVFTVRFYNTPKDRMFDFETTVIASQGDITFGDTKEGTMGIRVAESMKLKKSGKGGHIVLSTGARDQDAWAKRADWCDYNGPVGGKIVGIAMFDRPGNPSYPTWWHVRDYGLFAANPFGVHDFEKNKPEGAGNLTVPAGKSVSFRYRIYIHAGDEKQADVAGHYADYIKAAGMSEAASSNGK